MVKVHYNEVNSYIFVKFKANDSEVNVAPLRLDNLLKNLSVDNVKETGLYGYVYNFSVNYDSIDVAAIWDIHKYLMKRHNLKKCLDMLKNYLLDY